MIRASRPAATTSAALLALVSIEFGAAAAQAQLQAPAACTVPAPPGDELKANPDSSITITLTASPGASSYNIYRSTTSGAEGSTPYASTTATTYVDKNLSSTPIYFYEFTAVNSSGESARSREAAAKTPPPQSTGGTTPYVASRNSLIFYCNQARLA